MAKEAKTSKLLPFPLKHTDVQASIAGYIASVDVTQQYQNPYAEKIEAVYVFPLPHNAAVNEFVMTIGERHIRGIIREREEAQRIYQEAKSQGYVASLLTQERPNIFTQSVANIEPGKQIDINIRYFHTLDYADGWYEFVFPMVVGPRFNPPGSTAGVGAVAQGQPGISGQKTEVQYLRPGERNGHDISLTVNLDAGVALEEVQCRSHVTTAAKSAPGQAVVQLSPLDAIPNKDFVLRYKVVGKEIKGALLTHKDSRGGYFTLMLYPPESLAALPRQPMEMVFVLDCSGSMNGKPIEQAKAATIWALKHMQPTDTFQIIEFNDQTSQWGDKPVPATPQNIAQAVEYVQKREGSGGTMMNAGITAALGFPHDPQRLRVVSFLTDGLIGNESEILATVHEKLGDSRVFSFGVGSSCNRFLMDGLAKMGRGAVAYLGPNDSGAEVMDRYFERISHPAMTDVRVDFGSLQVTDLYPAQIPDLFTGRPVIVTGRFTGDTRTIRVVGKIAGQDQQMVLPVNLDAPGTNHPAIAPVWARTKIAGLCDQAVYARNVELPQQVKQLALEYCLVSAYTSFVAVDALTRTTGDHGTTVAVPVPVPDGVRYDTTVQERGRAQ